MIYWLPMTDIQLVDNVVEETTKTPNKTSKLLSDIFNKKKEAKEEKSELADAVKKNKKMPKALKIIIGI